MLFNSYEFIFAFLPIMFFGYFYLTQKRYILGSKLWLVGGSLFFYGWWNILYLPLLLSSIAINYFIGQYLGMSTSNKHKKHRTNFLILGILFNIFLLSFYKYTDFFLENFNGIFHTNAPLQHILLPLGISFFTFTQIAYLVDSYKGYVKEYSILNYALFVSYFPHLLAGPILHHKEMMPQFEKIQNYAKNYRNIAMGLFLFSIGLFKKVMIADTFAIWSTNGFEHTQYLSLIEAWATSLSYTFQLYFDFSGYTDMAIGVSLMFNIKLPINFNSPYKATDIQDFWRRWHITLSRFLRDYIYIPIGGNQVKRLQNYINLLTVFLIGGIWHGAGWTFVIWGALHGIAIVMHRIWQDLHLKMNTYLAWFITFNFINITWIFFRANDFNQAFTLLRRMFNISYIKLPGFLESHLLFLTKYITFGAWITNVETDGGKTIIPYLVVFFFILLFSKNSTYYSQRFNFRLTYFLSTVLLLLISILNFTHASQFIYFNF